MNERTHRHLDGELRRDALTPEELEEVARCEHFIREAGAMYRSTEVPDLTQHVMGKLPTEIPTKTAKSIVSRRATRGFLSAFVEDSLRWLWTPRVVRFRPAYGLLAITGFLLMLVLPKVNSRLLPQTTKTAVANVDTNQLATKVFVQFRLDAPQASVDGADARERYFRYFPSARQYDQTHAFAVFRLELVRVRFIGGFGRICWIEPGEFMTTNPFSSAQESRIIQNMNNDHSNALRQYCGGGPTEMAGIDAEGFDVLKSSRKVRLTFDTPIRNIEDARQALAAIAKCKTSPLT